jgi:hypothetical protein
MLPAVSSDLPSSSLRVLPLLGLLALAVPWNARAQTAGDGAAPPSSSPQPAPAPALPPDEALERAGARIGEIHVVSGNVFDEDDPREARRVFHLVNRLHRTTRPRVVERQLLFRPGDPYSPRLLAESERMLRGNRYLDDVAVRPVRYAGNQVDVEVRTRDIWTLNAGVSVGRKGGANSTRFELQDIDFLGLGKSLTLEHETGVDRTTMLFRYDDPALLGSRSRLELDYAENSDGRLRRIDLGQPFYSLDARWAAGLTGSSEERVDSLYALGHVAGRFRHQQDGLEIRGGLSHGLVDGEARRWSAGFTFLRDRFAPAAGFAPKSLLPAERTLSYPWIGFESVEDQYDEVRNLDHIARTEDLYLGTHYSLRLGWSSPLFGADHAAAVLAGSAGRGLQWGAGQTLLFSSDLTGRWGQDGPENLRLGGGARYYWRDFGGNVLFASLGGDTARHLDLDNQLLLGGDSGLRGYPLRYQSGDSRLLFTLEQRFFTGLYPFRLVHVGAAAFFDAGRVWAGQSGKPGEELGWLRDVGVGLRLSASRSGLGNIIHLDLAFPLDGDPSIQRSQFLVTTSTGF